MRYLLLVLFFVVQGLGLDANAIDLQNSSVENTLTLEKSNSEDRSYNQFRYYSPDTGVYLSQDPVGLAGGMPNMYAYVSDSNSWIDPLGLNTVGNPLSGIEKVFRIGSDLGMKSAEAALNPPGISVIRASSAKEAGEIMKKAFPSASRLHETIDAGNIMEATVDDIRKAGFDVVENPTKNLGDAHARLIHPDGADAFKKNESNLKKAFGGCH